MLVVGYVLLVVTRVNVMINAIVATRFGAFECVLYF